MSDVIEIYHTLFLFALMLPLFLAFFMAKRRQPGEPTQEPMWEEYCGGRVGWMQVTWPFIGLAVYPNSLRLSFVLPVEVPVDTIDKVSITKPHFPGSLFGERLVAIHFRDPSTDAERRQMLSVRGSSSLSETLRELEVHVEDADQNEASPDS